MKRIKPLAGFEKEYLISSSGEVFSRNKKILMKQLLDEKGYYRVSLYKKEKNKSHNHLRLVHRLIALTFLPNENPTIKTTINHINGIKTDNRIENLEWSSQKDNNLHSIKNGLNIKKNKTSKYVGVSYAKNVNKWLAKIQINYKQISLGFYNDEKDAQKAYNEYKIINNLKY